MIIIKDKKTISIIKNLKFVEKTENSRKTRILSSFLNAVFTKTVLHGGDYPFTKARLILDRLKMKRYSPLLPNMVKNPNFCQNPFFEN